MASNWFVSLFPLWAISVILVVVNSLPESNSDTKIIIWIEKMEKAVELSLKESENVKQENRQLKNKILYLEKDFALQQTRFTQRNHALMDIVQSMEKKLTSQEQRMKQEIKAVNKLFTNKIRALMKSRDKLKVKGNVSLEDIHKKVFDLRFKVARLEKKCGNVKLNKNTKLLLLKKLPKEQQRNLSNHSQLSIDVEREQIDNSKIKRGDDLGPLGPIVTELSQKVGQVTADIQTLKNQFAARSIGSTYIRWGNAKCPNASNIVYSGSVGGGWFDNYGSAANYLCLPHNPTFDAQDRTVNSVAGLWGAEYKTHPEATLDMTPACAVCRASRAATVMVPATHSCEAGWSLEYAGYLMTGYFSHQAASEYICVDRELAYMEGTKVSNDGKLLYFTTARCGSLSCPPFKEGRMIRCAVCSK